MEEYSKRIIGALEDVLYTFSNFGYEYPFIGEATGYYDHMTGTAIGITNVDIDCDNAVITTNNDLVHVINFCITGVGMFDVAEDLEGEVSFVDYIQSRFHWLKSYWKIIGGRTPHPDLEYIDDFDANYFKALLKDIESAFKIKIT